jgi:hypothetical protein
MKIRQSLQIGWVGCLLVGTLACSSDDSSTTGTGRGGATSTGSGGSGANGGKGGSGATGGAGTTGGAGGNGGATAGTGGQSGKGGAGGSAGSGAAGKAGTGGTGGTGGATGGSAGTGGATGGSSGSGGSGAAGAGGGTAGAGGTAGTGGMGGAAGTSVDAGSVDASRDTPSSDISTSDARDVVSGEGGLRGCGGMIPDPTRQALQGKGGPLSVSTYTVPSPSGWAGGTITYPTAAGTYPFVAVIAGGGRTTADVTWVADLLATWGFVTVATQGNPISIMPQQRAQQLTAALTQIIQLGQTSGNPISGKLNGRYGVAGHSLGGGGALYSTTDDNRWETGMAMAPWYSDATDAATGIAEPFLIWTDTQDSAVVNTTDGYRYYDNLPGEKMLIEVVGGHFAFSTTMIDPWDPNFPYGWDDQTRAFQNLLIRAWFSYWMCDDDRFLTYLCGTESQADHPASNTKVAIWRDSCAFAARRNASRH